MICCSPINHAAPAPPRRTQAPPCLFSDGSSAACGRAVLQNWEHPVRQVSGTCRDLYAAVLAAEDAVAAARGPAAADGVRGRRLEEVRRMLLGGGGAQAFAPLESLLPRVGATALLVEDPGLVGRLMDAVTAPGVCACVCVCVCVRACVCVRVDV
jgi:hypothetical protein